MTKRTSIIGMMVLCISFFLSACGGNSKSPAEQNTQQDSEAPQVIKCFPANNSEDVDPALDHIYVVFNEEMMPGNFAWAYTNKEDFPQKTGEPYYTDHFTKSVLPVKLEPGKTYEIWINSKTLPYFKDKSGNSAIPFRWTFKTRDQ